MILIVDDNQDIRELIGDILKDEGYKVSYAYNVKTTLDQLSSQNVKLVILDIWLEGSHIDGTGLLKVIKSLYKNIIVIMISGHANAEIAAKTIKLGAYDFIEKPFNTKKISLLVKRALQMHYISEINNSFTQKSTAFDLLTIGNSKKSKQLKLLIKKAYTTNSRILIEGQVGMGKSYLAKEIHTMSDKSSKPLITFNAKNSSILELENVIGEITQIEATTLGTIFLDDLHHIPMALQNKLLLFLRKNILENKDVDLKIIGSCNNAQEMMKRGRLSESLYDFLNIISIDLDSLKSRKEDIEDMIYKILSKLERGYLSNKLIISPQLILILSSYDWKGNIRELILVVESIAMQCFIYSKEIASVEMIPQYILGKKNENKIIEESELLNKSYKQAKQMFEEEYLKIQLARSHHNIAKTAKNIGMNRAALYRKVKSFIPKNIT